MKKNIYSIRKSKFGAVSTKIAAVTFLMLAGGVAVSELNTTAYAAETTQNKNEERKIESPVEYTADSAKEVGYKEVKVQGNDGKFTLKNNGNESIAERVEPTKTEVVLGTKPKVEKEIEKAKIEYKVDDTKEYGVREVVKEAKDGEKTTTTTYKIVTKPKVKLSEKIEKITFGMSGVETSLALMINAFNEGKISLETIQKLMCENPAKIMKIEKRGKLQEGYFADVIVVDTKKEWIVGIDDTIESKCGWTPYENWRLKGKNIMTIVNGEIVYENGKINENVKSGKEVKFYD